MNGFKIFIIFMITVGVLETSYAQTNESNRELKVSDALVDPDIQDFHSKYF